MKLRFQVDQAECFRNGIDCPKSIVTIEVEPATLNDKARKLIADRLDGIDVCELSAEGVRLYHSQSETERVTGKLQRPFRITAKAPTFEALVEAIWDNNRAKANAKAGAKRQRIVNKLVAETVADVTSLRDVTDLRA